MEYNNINGSAECPQIKDLTAIEGQKHATDGVKTGNYEGKSAQPKGQKGATVNTEGVKRGNYQQEPEAQGSLLKDSLPTQSTAAPTRYDQGVLPQEWLYNPVVYSQVSGDFSLLQQRILGGVLSMLQDRILYTINEKEQNKRFPSLFTDEEMGEVIELDIDPDTLGITPDHYGDLDDALSGLARLTMGFPKYVKGQVNYVIAPLFARIEMPRGEIRRTGRVHVYILRKNAEDFFSLAHGYTVHLARITQLAKKKRTPRIYIFLSSFRDIGHKEIDYHAFCKFLGIDEETARADLMVRLDELVKLHHQEERDNIEPRKRRGITSEERRQRLEKWENPLRKYNKVRSQIIDPTKQELDTFMQRGEIDFSFNYEALYKGGSRRGNPTHIRFVIVKGPLALERDEVILRRRRTYRFTTTMCKWCSELKAADLQQLCDPLPDVMLQDFMDYGYKDVRQLVERQQPDDVAAYTLTMLRQWITANQPEYERRHWRQVWQQCHQDLLSQTTNEQSRSIVGKVGYESYDTKKNLLTLIVPDKATIDFLEQPAVLGRVIKPTLERHYGLGIRLQYNII